MEVVFGLAVGAGVLYFAKRGGTAVRGVVGWTARKTGWIASRVRTSVDETRAVAREQYERGRAEAKSDPVRVTTNGQSQPHP
jgi:hypothetical protein